MVQTVQQHQCRWSEDQRRTAVSMPGRPGCAARGPGSTAITWASQHEIVVRLRPAPNGATTGMIFEKTITVSYTRKD
ncbi:MAG TPA: hypothetical protein DDZ76_07390 [Xanthomonadales bacterium]|nr:hypothetical protein [Xanthomonadales bacterium]